VNGIPMPGDRTSNPAPRRRELSLDEYAAGVQAGDVGVLARAVTLIESSLPRHQRMAEQLLTRLLPASGNAIRVGVTGAPGSGKSTFIEALGLHLVGLGRRVAVLAVDPTSGVTGGSILGDKTRMTQLAAEPSVYIRPSPAAGTPGGVALKTRESMILCEASGYDVVLVETVGVGQSETMVADMTDCCLALLLPGAGDELQGIKRGLLERVDVVVVNKADGATQSAAQLAARQYAGALATLSGRDEQDAPVVLTCSALRRIGIDTVWQAIARRHERLQQSCDLERRRQRQNLHWLWSVVQARLANTLDTHAGVTAVRDEIERQVSDGTLPVEAAARKILEALGIRDEWNG